MQKKSLQMTQIFSMLICVITVAMVLNILNANSFLTGLDRFFYSQ